VNSSVRLPDGRVLRLEQPLIEITEMSSPGIIRVPGRTQFYLDDDPITPGYAQSLMNGEPYYHIIPKEN
jgi:hypothetical protein